MTRFMFCNTDKGEKPNIRKRKFEEMDSARVETEKWNLKHVVFLPEQSSGSGGEIVGKIVRMDGNICAVSFNGADNIQDAQLKLMMKEELCLANQEKSSKKL